MARPADAFDGGLLLPAGVVSSGRRLLPKEPRRREVLAVLTLLLVASLFSVTGGMVGATSAISATDSIALADPTMEATPTPTDAPTLAPSATPSPTPKPTAKPTPRPVVKPKPKVVRTFVALGDSLTSGYGASGPAWPSRLDGEDSLLRLIKNVGVPGNTTAQMLRRMTTDVYAYHPQVLFVLGGTNDLGLGISGNTIIANLKAIIVGAKAHKITVVMLLVPPDGYTNMVARIDSLNAAIMRLAISQKISVANIHDVLSNSKGLLQPRYTVDGLHFSNLGAQVAANAVWARVKRLGF
jgi:lysophospholipase L1-like esterase